MHTKYNEKIGLGAQVFGSVPFYLGYLDSKHLDPNRYLIFFLIQVQIGSFMFGSVWNHNSNTCKIHVIFEYVAWIGRFIYLSLDKDQKYLKT